MKLDEWQEKDIETEVEYYSIEALESKRRKQTSFLRRCLAQYFEHVERRKTKTGIEKYNLLSGRLVRKPAARKIVRASEEELITWCAASGMPTDTCTTSVSTRRQNEHHHHI